MATTIPNMNPALDASAARWEPVRGRTTSLPQSLPSPNRLDHATYNALVEPLLPQLRRVAGRIVGGDDLAEDALQEALLSLWLLDAWPPNLAGWLARAVVFRSLHLQRSRKRRRTHEARACLQLPEVQATPEVGHALESAELATQLAGFLAALPPAYRAAFELRVVERLDYGSIARQLGIPVGTVRSRLNRSRKTLLRMATRLGIPSESRDSRNSGDRAGL